MGRKRPKSALMKDFGTTGCRWPNIRRCAFGWNPPAARAAGGGAPGSVQQTAKLLWLQPESPQLSVLPEFDLRAGLRFELSGVSQPVASIADRARRSILPVHRP